MDNPAPRSRCDDHNLDRSGAQPDNAGAAAQRAQRMIVRPRLHWLRMLFVVRGSVLPAILPQLLGVTVLAMAVTLLHGHIGGWKISLNFVPFSLIGLTLAIFLGFRNGTSYARWWEARTLWGSLLNETRSLLRQALTLPSDPAPARELALRLMAFVHALRLQLRQVDPQPELQRLLPAADLQRLQGLRQPCAVLLLMCGEWLRERVRQGHLAPALVPALEVPLGRLTEALGGCERIAGTPIPFTYSVIIHRTVYLYCLLLPFGLVDSIGATTPVAVAFIAYTFFALEALGAEIEEPFGTDPNDLPLDALAHGIECSLREMLGEREMPAAPEVRDFVLR